MDDRAVVALLVVLDDDLPVGLDDVVMPGDGAQPFRGVWRDDGLDGSDVRTERARIACRIGENPAVPLDDPDRRQPELRGVEALDAAITRRAAQRSVQAVRPAVVRADDRVAARRRVTWQQLVPAVPAGVGERAQLAVVGADEQDPALAGVDGSPAAGCGQVLDAAQAHPAAEEVRALPVEDGRVDVCRARQHPAAAEVRQRGRELSGVDRRGHATHFCASLPAVRAELVGPVCAVVLGYRADRLDIFFGTRTST